VTGTVKAAARLDRWSRSWPRIFLSAGLTSPGDSTNGRRRSATVFSQARPGGLRRKADPGRMAVALLAAVQGGALLAQLRRGPSHPETALDEVLDRIEDLQAQAGSTPPVEVSQALVGLLVDTRPPNACSLRTDSPRGIRLTIM
jgi:hypothetical protein